MFKLGLVTYDIAKNWDLETLIAKCEAAGVAAVELRTSHPHGVEPTLGKEERQRVKERFANSKVKLGGLGSVCEYHAADPAVVEKNIESTIEWIKLAADVGAMGVKVRPNGFQEAAGIPREKTIEQIGKALQRCGKVAADYGVEIWLEVHGRGTSRPDYVRQMLEIADHPSVGACWNSNPDEPENGSIARWFAMLKPFIRWCHIHDLIGPYPYRELFSLLQEAGYDRYTMAELPASSDPERVLNYYAALWREMLGQN